MGRWGAVSQGWRAGRQEPDRSRRPAGLHRWRLDTIKLDGNENPYGLGPAALEAIQRALPLAPRYLRNAETLVEALARRHAVEPSWVLLSAGSGDLLRAAVDRFTSPDRALVVPEPTYEASATAARRLRRPLRAVPVDADLRLDLPALTEAAADAGLLYLCNPNNPTSTSVGGDGVATLVRALAARAPETTMLVDEAYADYAADPGYRSAIDLARIHPRVVVIRTFSKIFAMAGLRVGYAIAQPGTLGVLRAALPIMTLNVLGIAAATAAVGDTAHLATQVALNRDTRTRTVADLREAGLSRRPVGDQLRHGRRPAALAGVPGAMRRARRLRRTAVPAARHVVTDHDRDRRRDDARARGVHRRASALDRVGRDQGAPTGLPGQTRTDRSPSPDGRRRFVRPESTTLASRLHRGAHRYPEPRTIGGGDCRRVQPLADVPISVSAPIPAWRGATMRLSNVFGFSTDLAIDLGTANTCVFAPGRGIVLNEPSVVAFNTTHSRIEAVGTSAKEMLGRTPQNMVAIKPLRDGVIADFDAAERMLTDFIKRSHHRRSMWVRPRVVIGVPAEITQVERRAVQESTLRAKASEVYLVDEPVAAAIGAGLPITEPTGNMIVDIGGGTTDIAVISMAGVVYSRSVRVAGNEMDEALIDHMRKVHGLLIGERTAEQIKIEIGSAAPLDERMFMEVRGRHISEGIPKSITICDGEVRDALRGTIDVLVHAVRDVLERIPPELSADIFDRGVVVTGGGSLLRNLDKRLREDTQLPVTVAEDPLSSVVMGAGRMLSDLPLLKRLAAA